MKPDAIRAANQSTSAFESFAAIYSNAGVALLGLLILDGDQLNQCEFSNRSLTQLPVPLEDRSNKTRAGKTSWSSTALGGFVRWATTPPQAIAVYLICFILVAGLSFYVGTLKPRKTIDRGPPAASVPRN